MTAADQQPIRRTGDLHRHRWSVSASRYFITICAQRPGPCLTAPTTSDAICSAWRILDKAGDIVLDYATIMPDHLHLLLILGARLSLGRVVAKFKALTRDELQGEGSGWQRDFFEHRLHPDEHPSAFARYIFLNPYRAGLLERRAIWPHTYLRHGADFDFLTTLDDDRYPPAEWLSLPNEKLGLDIHTIGND